MPSVFAQAMNPANNTYGRPVSEADIRAAQFQNYLKAPAPVQKLLQHYSPDSDGYARIQNAQASAAADLAARPGVRQIGTDGQVHDFAAPAPTQAQLAEATLARVPRAMELLNPALGQGLSSPGAGPTSRAHVPQQPAANPITVGEVNGVKMAIPTAGNYTNGAYASAISQLNPAFMADANDGISMDRVDGAREAQQYLAAGLPLPEHLRHLNPNLGLTSDISQKQRTNAALAAEKEHQRKLQLATEPERIKAEADKYAADRNAEAANTRIDREMQGLYRQQLSKHQHDTQYIKGRYDREQKTRNAIARAARSAESNTPGSEVLMPDGTSVPKGQVEAYLLDKARLDPGGLPPIEEYAANLGYDLTTPVNPFSRPSGAQSAAKPATTPAPGKPFKSGYTTAQLDSVTDRATAIARLRKAGDEEAARYLESKG